MIGRTLGHYQILDSLGSGGMGDVYRAHDALLDRDVALKVLNRQLGADPTHLARFSREAKLLASLNHPNIAAIYGLEQSEDTPFLVLELIEGDSLAQRVAGERLGVIEALAIARQIATALESAHEHHIIHRDLKPANVMLTADGTAKVLDFGIARRLDHDRTAGSQVRSEEATGLTVPGELAGTIPYMSPEQIRGVPLDKRSDIWAFGCVLFEMLAGQPAFGRETPADTLAAIMESEPDWSMLPKDLPPAAKSLLRRCLHKDPHARLRDLGDARIELGESLEPLASSPTAVAAARRSHPAAAPRWAWRAVGAIVLLTAFAAFVYTFLPRSAAPMGIGPSGRPAVAVVAFENRTGSDELNWLEAGVPEMLLTGLAQTPGLDVVASQRIYEVVNRMKPSDSGPVGYMEVARRVGAGAVVTGSVFNAAGEMRIDVQVADVASGRLLSGYSVNGAEIFSLVDELAGSICDGLGVTSSANPPVAQVTTDSLEAYRLYFEAQVARRNLRLMDAGVLLAQAIELDPSFGLAHLELYHVARRNGDMLGLARSREAVRRVADRMPERDRLYAEATLARDDRDLDRTIATLETLLTRFPDHRDAYVLLSSVYAYDRDDVARAVETLERGVAALPTSSSVHNQLGYMLLSANRFDDAVEALETYGRLAPEEPNALDSLGDAYLMMGEPARALALYDQVVARQSSYTASYMGRAWALAMLGDYPRALQAIAQSEDIFGQVGYVVGAWSWTGGLMLSRVGRYREAEELLNRGAALMEQVALPVFVADHHFLLAAIAIERGQHTTAIESVARGVAAFADSTDENLVDEDDRARWEMSVAHLLYGTAQARAGDLEGARQAWEAQARITDNRTEWEEFFHRTLEGEIALAEGDLDAAEGAFAAAEPDGKMWFVRQTPALSVFANNLSLRDGTARVQIARGDTEGSIGTYRDLTTPSIESTYTSIIEPRYVLELARLLDANGDAAAAEIEYARFIELWADADDNGGALVSEARERAASIVSRSTSR